MLPPSLHFEHPNRNVDWDDIPFRVNTELREWPAHRERRALRRGERVRLRRHQLPRRPRGVRARPAPCPGCDAGHSRARRSSTNPQPRRGYRRPPDGRRRCAGAAVVGGADDAEVAARLEGLGAEASAGRVPAPAAPDPALAGAAVRVAIDYADAADLAAKAGKAVQALRRRQPGHVEDAARPGRIRRPRRPGPRSRSSTPARARSTSTCSRTCAQREPIVAETFAEADRVMTPLLGRPLTDVHLRRTTPTRPPRSGSNSSSCRPRSPSRRCSTTDLALTRLLDAYGVRPGHGDGPQPRRVRRAGRRRCAVASTPRWRRSAPGAARWRACRWATTAPWRPCSRPLAEIERIVAEIDGYVVIANINSTSQAVIGGATDAVERAVAAFQAAGMNAVADPGQPRVPHLDRGAGERAAEGGAAPARRAAAESADRGERDRRLLPGRTPTPTRCSICWAARSPRRCSSSTACTRCTTPAPGSSSRSARRRRCTASSRTCSAHDDVLALFTNHPKIGDVAVVQPGAVRAVRGRARLCRARRPSPPLPPPPQVRRPR